VIPDRSWKTAWKIVAAALLLGACAITPQVTRVQEVADSAETPYQKVLVVGLFESFDARRHLETEVVRQLQELGTEAIASTSMMNSRTPVSRQTFVSMVEKVGADSVLVTHLISLESDGKNRNMNPQSTRNIRPTYYYNVWSVELTEYVEPQSIDFEHSLKLATQLYAVASQDAVWGIEVDTSFKQDSDHLQDYSLFVDEASAITHSMAQDGLVARR
jgi:hypothetical protein